MRIIIKFFIAFSLITVTINLSQAQINFRYADSLFFKPAEVIQKPVRIEPEDLSVKFVAPKKTGFIPVQYTSMDASWLYCDFETAIKSSVISPNEKDTFLQNDTETGIPLISTEYANWLKDIECEEYYAEPPRLEVTQVSTEEVNRIFSSFNMTFSMTYNRHVQNHIDYFTKKDPYYIKLMLTREYKYLKIFEDALKEYDMPDELKYLVIVESGISPTAISRSGAGGLWQFIPSTGKLFGLNITEFVYERMDPYKSSIAAARYLKQLFGFFNDWQLALAAYNCGPGAISRAMRRSGGKDFWSIYKYLPVETKSYVPSFIAITYLMNNSHFYGICEDELDRIYDYEILEVSEYLNLNKFANYLEIPLKAILSMNPELRTNIVPGACENPYYLRIPLRLARRVFEKQNEALVYASFDPQELKNDSVLAKNNFPLVRINHIVRKGETPIGISKRYAVQVADLFRWNENKTDNLIYPGQHLLIWKAKTGKEKYDADKVYSFNSSLKNKNSKYKNNGKQKVYLVSPGDTLWSICQKYNGLSVEKIKQLNNLKGNNIKPGQKLVLG
ncbi:MAG: hypothetical protein A3G23_06745 [Bacteroidetes bacterium RIFCSPLOWO2_12_FULL_37_12]|nr:MAG: hypothetical protein A3G23_06745 [Bacteroidetes bacterium RIFCSPLOWO2_12_FULL_37_12]